MKCPFCDTQDSKVIDSRVNQTSDITRRRRECIKCAARFTTYERIEEITPVIIKKDGRREAFQREKVLSGLKKATQKRDVPMDLLDQIVDRVEKHLQRLGHREYPSKGIGLIVMSELHRIDKVAYIRFSSVYREFADVEEFVAELQDPTRFPILRPETETLPESPGVNTEFPFVKDLNF